jgi:hypothetical protein
MTILPLTRCQFLIPFAAICDEIGAPTEALLTKFRLPASLQEKAEHYVPILQAIRFAEAAQRSQGITDIGFQAARQLQFCHLSEKMAPSSASRRRYSLPCSNCANGRRLKTRP